MKVCITSDGCLLVTGTTGTEIYALTRWYEQWKSGKAMFKVEGEEVRTAGAQGDPEPQRDYMRGCYADPNARPLDGLGDDINAALSEENPREEKVVGQ